VLDVIGSYARRGEYRHFVHGRIKRAVTGIIRRGPIGAIDAFLPQPSSPTAQIPELAGVRGGGSGPPFRGGHALAFGATHTAHTHARAVANLIAGRQDSQHYRQFASEVEELAGRGDPLVGGTGCNPPLISAPGGECVFPGSPASGDVAGGVAVMGQYGAAMIPETETRTHRDCLPGMVLGKDRLCYNKSQISNKERLYPKGRPPLLTGGERNAITKARRAAGKIETTVKSLQKMGMIKKPGRRSMPARKAPLALPAGTSIVNVE